MISETSYRHACAVRHTGSLDEKTKGLYREYDKHDRCVYELDLYGFWSLMYYSDEPDQWGRVYERPHTIIHKYYFLYNPQQFIKT